MRLVVIVYLVLSVLFMILFFILDGWEGVRAHIGSVIVVAAFALIGAGFVWLGKKFGIRINNGDDWRIDK